MKAVDSNGDGKIQYEGMRYYTVGIFPSIRINSLTLLQNRVSNLCRGNRKPIVDVIQID
jgi:hypothetical protein